MLNDIDFQKHCGIIKLIESHTELLLTIGDQEDFEVVRLKCDCTQMLAISCVKINRKNTACDLLTRLLRSIMVYIDNTLPEENKVGLHKREGGTDTHI